MLTELAELVLLVLALYSRMESMGSLKCSATLKRRYPSLSAALTLSETAKDSSLPTSTFTLNNLMGAT